MPFFFVALHSLCIVTIILSMEFRCHVIPQRGTKCRGLSGLFNITLKNDPDLNLNLTWVCSRLLHHMQMLTVFYLKCGVWDIVMTYITAACLNFLLHTQLFLYKLKCQVVCHPLVVVENNSQMLNLEILQNFCPDWINKMFNQ